MEHAVALVRVVGVRGPRCGSVGMYVLGPACHEIIDPQHFSLVTWQTECRTCQVYWRH